MRFDGYAASIRGRDFQEVTEAVASGLGAGVRHGQARRRYGLVFDLELAGRQAAWVGLDRGNELVYVEGKGETTPDLVDTIRRHFPDHAAPRLDVCEDFDQEGAFDQLVGFVRAHKGPKVKGGYVNLPDDPEGGRTWAAGVRGGVGYIRAYEAGKMADRLHFRRPNWARLELEARPHSAAEKVAASRMDPVEVWGLTGWTHRVGTALAGFDLPRYEAAVQRTTRHKTTVYLARTFRRHWEWMLQQEGGDQAAVMQRLAEVWREDDEVAAELARRTGRTH